jgi:hypothetical protein
MTSERAAVCAEMRKTAMAACHLLDHPERLHLTPRGKEPMTMSDPDVEPDDPRRLAQIRGEDVGVSEDIDRQTDDPRELVRGDDHQGGPDRDHEDQRRHDRRHPHRC